MAWFQKSGYHDPNAVLQAAYRRFFERIEIDESWVQIVRQAAGRGPVVYVLRNLSFLDFLALDYLTKKHELPRLGFANDSGSWLLEPFARNWTQALRPSVQQTPEQQLTDVIRAGGSAALFLKRPPTLIEKATRWSRRRISSEGDALVRALFELQRQTGRPIMLVPQVFVWSKRPAELRPSWVDAVFGPREWPGSIRTAAQFLLNYEHVLLRAGEPIALSDWIQGHGPEDDDRLVRQGTYALLRKLERQRRTVLGPVRKPTDRMRDEVIRSPKLQTVIRELGGENKRDRLLLTARAYRILAEMQALPDPSAVHAIDVPLSQVIKSSYSGVEVDEPGMERLREAAQQGTIVLLPSHKSHMDYVLLSWILHHHALQIPLVAAGENLSFFPIGPFLRKGGAFFIRRSFKGDRLYSAVVEAYLRRLLRDGWPVEFFLEGGRSRTGKLLRPRYGLLHMTIDSALALRPREVYFVPISIGYERLMEEHSYVRELLGGEKRKEDPTALVRTLRTLAERYGRLNVQVGQMVRLSDALADLEQRPAPADVSETHELGSRIAHRVMAEINACTAATPGAVVAMSLLAHPRRGLAHDQLVTRVRQIVSLLQNIGARMTSSLATETGLLRPTAVPEAVRMFQQASLIQANIAGESLSSKPSKEQRDPAADTIYSVPESKRLALDISKNIILHFFVPYALMAMGLLAETDGPPAKNALRERVQWLSRLFKYEFMFRADAPFEQIFEETLGAMAGRGELRVSDGGRVEFAVGHDGMNGKDWIQFYARLLDNFVEAYRVMARTLVLLLKGPLSEKELCRRALTVGDRMYLAGDIARRESLSKSWFESAIRSLADLGYVQIGDDKRVTLTQSFCDPETVTTIESRISQYLVDSPGTGAQ